MRIVGPIDRREYPLSYYRCESVGSCSSNSHKKPPQFFFAEREINSFESPGAELYHLKMPPEYESLCFYLMQIVGPIDRREYPLSYYCCESVGSCLSNSHKKPPQFFFAEREINSFESPGAELYHLKMPLEYESLCFCMMRIAGPIDRCECPPNYCRCESVGSCSSNSPKKPPGFFFAEREINSVEFSPGAEQYHPKMPPVHESLCSCLMRIASPIDRCECPPSYCRCCEESVSSCSSNSPKELRGFFFVEREIKSVEFFPRAEQYHPKTPPLHVPYHSLMMRIIDPIDRCECPYCCCREGFVGTCSSSNTLELRLVEKKAMWAIFRDHADVNRRRRRLFTT